MPKKANVYYEKLPLRKLIQNPYWQLLHMNAPVCDRRVRVQICLRKKRVTLLNLHSKCKKGAVNFMN